MMKHKKLNSIKFFNIIYVDYCIILYIPYSMIYILLTTDKNTKTSKTLHYGASSPPPFFFAVAGAITDLLFCSSATFLSSVAMLEI